jgi:hypothetical protein
MHACTSIPWVQSILGIIYRQEPRERGKDETHLSRPVGLLLLLEHLVNKHIPVTYPPVWTFFDPPDSSSFVPYLGRLNVPSI